LNYCWNFDINCYDSLNVQIMVKTRSLGRTLGKVIERSLGRQVNRDSDEAPLRCVEAKLHGESRVIQRCFDDNKRR